MSGDLLPRPGRFSLEAQNERARKSASFRNSLFLPEPTQPETRRFRKSYCRAATLLRSIIEIRHKPHRFLVVDRPERHQQIASSRLDKAAPQTEHALTGASFAGSRVTGRQHYQPCSLQIEVSDFRG